MATTPRQKATVRVKVTGADGKAYEGDFTWYRRNIADAARIAAETTRIMSGAEVPSTAPGNMVSIMAELNVVTEECPPWWDYNTLHDYAVFMGVYNRYVEWRESFFAPKRLKPVEDADGEDGQGSADKPDRTGTA